MKNNMSVWKNEMYSLPSQRFVSSKPGIYAIMSVRRLAGMPLGVEILYVGKSINLQRRFGEHLNPWREHNRGLNNLPKSNSLEFWYYTLPKEEISNTEKYLIQTLNPKYNQLLRKAS
jgi:excinuclease UvrABC nuclease subunit